MVIDGTSVAVEWTMRGAVDGEPFGVHGCDMFAFEGSQIAQFRQYRRFDPSEPGTGLVSFPYG